MPEPKHSPGPWFLDLAEGQPIQVRHFTDEREPSDIVVEMPCWIEVFEEEELANAHLIAAAPELLAAVKKLVWFADDALSDRDGFQTRKDREYIKDIMALIAKAEGKD